MPWSALSRVDTINEKIIQALSKAFCIELKFGLESGSDTILKNMNKKNTVADAQRALDLCEFYGIKAKLFLIHGFPGENYETTIETINFLKKNQNKINRVSLFSWTPLPGSYVYNNPDIYGLNKNILTFENAIIYSENKNWFIDSNYNKIVQESLLKLKEFISDKF